MKCSKCGAEVKEGNDFCTNCGNKVEIQLQKDSGQMDVVSKLVGAVIGVLLVGYAVLSFLGSYVPYPVFHKGEICDVAETRVKKVFHEDMGTFPETTDADIIYTHNNDAIVLVRAGVGDNYVKYIVHTTNSFVRDGKGPIYKDDLLYNTCDSEENIEKWKMVFEIE